MRAKKEIIKLDATIVDVIKPSVFVSELGNGHRMVVVAARRRPGAGKSGVALLKSGDRIVVEASPGDMATGRVVNF